MSVKQIEKKLSILGLVILGGLVFSILLIYFFIPYLFSKTVNQGDVVDATTPSSVALAQLLGASGSTTPVVEATTTAEVAPFVATHIEMPKAVKAVYMTSWVAGTPSLRTKIVDLIDTTEINSIVLDIKDDTGRISFEVYDPMLKEIGAEEIRIRDLREFIADLHSRNIYVIGRVSSFQDPYMVKQFPERAVKRESDGGVWKDRKGISWIDAGNKDQWEYLVAIAKESYAAGFDEINFDYIRFPSDGNMMDISYPYSEGKAKHLVLRSFFEYLHDTLSGTGMKISADLFGMVTTNTDDLGIGQIMEDALPYFDAVAPMVYPSHYPPNFNGWKNPNAVPYDLMYHVMSEAVKRAEATTTKIHLTESEPIASTTPQLYTKNPIDRNKLRPWLQDFSLGQPAYGAKEVRDQIQATYDSGLTSWMLWDAANTYTESALLPE